MTSIVSFHSFRRGTGRTTLIASLAVLLARAGHRVGVIDTDVESPSCQVLFGVEEADVRYYLNDYMHGKCTIEAATMDITDRAGPSVSGSILLVPANPSPVVVMQVLRESMDMDRLRDGFTRLSSEKELNVLLVDTHAGLHEHSMAAMATATRAIFMIRIDRQDYQGTAVMMAVAHSLGVEEEATGLVVNMMPPNADRVAISMDSIENFDAKLMGLLPYSERLQALASREVFAQKYPEHPVTHAIEGIAAQLV
ncbi:MAG: MinD/ParA family protein [Anaerolineae bacterium]